VGAAVRRGPPALGAAQGADRGHAGDGARSRGCADGGGSGRGGGSRNARFGRGAASFEGEAHRQLISSTDHVNHWAYARHQASWTGDGHTSVVNVINWARLAFWRLPTYRMPRDTSAEGCAGGPR